MCGALASRANVSPPSVRDLGAERLGSRRSRRACRSLFFAAATTKPGIAVAWWLNLSPRHAAVGAAEIEALARLSSSSTRRYTVLASSLAMPTMSITELSIKGNDLGVGARANSTSHPASSLTEQQVMPHERRVPVEPGGPSLV